MTLKSWQIKMFITLGFVALFTGIALTKLIVAFNNLKDVEQLDAYSHYSVPTKILDIKGRLITEYFLEKRNIISFNDLPHDLIRAIIATEDNRFYQHGGVNVVAMIQGVVFDPLRGRRARGGSGLTQQLAKLLFTDSSRSIQRKLIELWYALQIEKKYSKEEILELYFNLIYFGHGQYGIEAASKFYFDKPAKLLTLAEASFLAGLPQAPSRYSPINNYKSAQERHKIVLNSMVNSGYISQAEADQTFKDFWTNYDASFTAATRNIQQKETEVAGFFTEYVRQQLLERYGEELLYKGGLEVHTTLNLDYQKAANIELEKALSNEQEIYSGHYARNSSTLKKNYEDIIDLLGLSLGLDSFSFSDTRTEKIVSSMVSRDQDLISLASFVLGLDTINMKIDNLNNSKHLVARKEDSVEGALVSIDPYTGYINAMIGGRHYSVANQFNRATQARRQMGSTFKPLLYAIALDNKIITPSEIFVDEILSYKLPNGNTWVPRNYNGTYQGPMTARRALRLSVNIIAIQIWERMIKLLGYDFILNQLSLFFGTSSDSLTKRIHNELATALGTGTASPLEMAQAFGVIANGGMSVEPIAILKVYDRNGQLIDDFKVTHDSRPKVRVISEGTAKIMQSLLHDIMQRGTAAGAAMRAGYNTRNSGGKTGTTSNWTDSWFAGITSNLSTVIWIGLDDSRKALGKSRSSAVTAAPIWMNYMKKVNSLTPISNLPFQQSTEGLKTAFVSSYTGLLATAQDTEGYTEYFLPGTEPQTYSDAETIARIQAQMAQKDNYEVSGETVDLTTHTNNSNPYILDQSVNSEELDLSFDLSSGL